MKAKILFCLMLLILGSCSLVVVGQDDYWFQKGIKTKNPDKKIEYFTKSIEMEGAKAETYLQRGDVYWSLAIHAAYHTRTVIIGFNVDDVELHNAKLRYDKAREDYTKAIMIDPTCIKAYMGRSDVYQQLGQKDEALADLSHLIQVDSNNAKWYLKRGSMYSNDFRDAEKSLPDLSKAIEIDSNYIGAYHVRGRAYYRLRQYEKAMADYSKLIEIDPNDAYAYCYRGDIYTRTGHYDKAISDYTRTIEIDRKYFMAYNNRGEVYLRQSEYEKALGDFDKAISLQLPDFPIACNNKGYIYLQQDKIDLAIQNFNKSLSINNESISPNVNLAIAYYMQADKTNAKSYLNQAKTLEPRLQNGMDGINALMDEGYYWTEQDKETLAKMFVEFK